MKTKSIALSAFVCAALAGPVLVAMQSPAMALYKMTHAPNNQRSGGSTPYCPTGTSWQSGCVKWGPAGPGQVVGACTQQAWSCKRSQ